MECEECTRRVIDGFASSYPFAETWHIEAPEDEVIAAILDVKAEDPLLQPPGFEELVSFRDTTSSTDYWRHVRFYYTDTEEIVHTWARPVDDYSTTFALKFFQAGHLPLSIHQQRLLVCGQISSGYANLKKKSCSK